MNDAQGHSGEARAGDPSGLVNVANVLTVVRIFLVPVFVVCLVHGGTGWRLAALAAFGGASFTDFLDGQLARKRGLVTDFGKIADPIADKALTGAALITLSALGELPWLGHRADPRPRARHHRAALRRHQARRHRGEPGRQAEDAAADHRDLPVRAAPLARPARRWSRRLSWAAALVVTLVTGADYVVRGRCG